MNRRQEQKHEVSDTATRELREKYRSDSRTKVPRTGMEATRRTGLGRLFVCLGAQRGVN